MAAPFTERPVLVGAKQALKESKQEVVIKAVGRFLQHVKRHDREISVTALPAMLKGFGLKLRNHDKQKRFFNLLKQWDWIYVRADYYHPDRHGGSGNQGRARAYGIGRAMASKFSLIQHTQHNGPILFLNP